MSIITTFDALCYLLPDARGRQTHQPTAFGFQLQLSQTLL